MTGAQPGRIIELPGRALLEELANADLLALSPAECQEAATPCAGRSEWFFSYDVADQERAKAMCRECPLRAPCFIKGVQCHDTTGPSVWGGVVFPKEEYRRMKRAEEAAA